MAEKKKPAKSGCFKSLLLGIGCGCVYPLAILVIISIVTWFSVANSIEDIIKPVKLPNFAGPTQQSFWKLQEKRLIALDKEKLKLNLSLDEFNAFLSAFSFKPYYGYYLNKIRYAQINKSNTFFFIGSGMFLRSLVFEFNFQIEDGENRLKAIKVNNWTVPAKGLIKDQIIAFIENLLKANNLLYKTTYNKDWKIKFLEEKIQLEGTIVSHR